MGQIVQFCQDKKLCFIKIFHQWVVPVQKLPWQQGIPDLQAPHLPEKEGKKYSSTWSKTYVLLLHNFGKIILKLMMKTCWYRDIQQVRILLKGIHKF